MRPLIKVEVVKAAMPNPVLGSQLRIDGGPQAGTYTLAEFRDGGRTWHLQLAGLSDAVLAHLDPVADNIRSGK